MTRKTTAAKLCDKQEYCCAHCPYTTKNKPSLKAHLKFHSTRKQFVCNVCNYKTVDKSNLKSHMKVHTGEKPHKCKQCEYRTTSKYYLKQHESIHTGDKLFTCKYCDKNFRYRNTLTEHERGHTGNLEVFQCSKCNYNSTNKKNFKDHTFTHSTERPFACEKCSYKAKSKKLLRKHERHNRCQPRFTINNSYDTYENNDKPVLQLETVARECVSFNSENLLIKEESDDELMLFVNGVPSYLREIEQDEYF